MRADLTYIGVDPGSSRVGVAIVSGTKLLGRDVWDVRGHKGAWRDGEIPPALHLYFQKLSSLISTVKPAGIVVEQLSVAHNMDTVRKIAYFEAASLMAGAAEGIPVASVKTTTARKAALGRGGLNKEAARELLSKLCGQDLSPDEADAYCLGIAGAHAFTGRLQEAPEDGVQ